MEKGFLKELQSLASNPLSDVTEVLLKAKILAKENPESNSEFLKWIDLELNGYENQNTIPPYRIGNGQLKAFNAYHGWQNFEFRASDARVIEKIQTFHLFESVSSMTGEHDAMMRLPINQSLAAQLLKNNQGYSDVSIFFSAGKLAQIVTAVRNRIIEWSCEVEVSTKKSLLSSEVGSPPIAYINNFYGNVNNAGVIGSKVNDISQSNTITLDDFDVLARLLKGIGATDDDVQELKIAIESSPKPESIDMLGDKIGCWLGKMIHKGFAGGLDLAATSVQSVITRALSSYYGLSY